MENEQSPDREWQNTVDTISDLAWAVLEHGRQHVADALGSIALIGNPDGRDD